MCETYGSLCQLCKAGVAHEEPKAKTRKGEFWRRHKSLALLVGKNEVADFEQHYAKHGVHVRHRETASGDYEPVITRHEQFEAMLKSRGLHERS